LFHAAEYVQREEEGEGKEPPRDVVVEFWSSTRKLSSHLEVALVTSLSVA